MEPQRALVAQPSFSSEHGRSIEFRTRVAGGLAELLDRLPVGRSEEAESRVLQVDRVDRSRHDAESAHERVRRRDRDRTESTAVLTIAPSASESSNDPTRMRAPASRTETPVSCAMNCSAERTPCRAASPA